MISKKLSTGDRLLITFLILAALFTVFVLYEEEQQGRKRDADILTQQREEDSLRQIRPIKRQH